MVRKGPSKKRDETFVRGRLVIQCLAEHVQQEALEIAVL